MKERCLIKLEDLLRDKARNRDVYQERLDKYKDIPCKEEKRRIKRQNATRNRNRKEYKHK